MFSELIIVCVETKLQFRISLVAPSAPETHYGLRNGRAVVAVEGVAPLKFQLAVSVTRLSWTVIMAVL